MLNPESIKSFIENLNLWAGQGEGILIRSPQ